MRLDFADIAELQPLIAATVHAVMDTVRADEARLPEQIAYHEAKAAALIGVPMHVLRDCRLRGEVVASKVGKSPVYRREDLLKFLAAQREERGPRR